jgi:hypothetical protein
MDSDANIENVCMRIKKTLALRADAKTLAMLDDAIDMRHDTSSTMAGLAMAMWSMCDLVHIKLDDDMFIMLIFTMQMVPWELCATTRETYVQWVVSTYKSIVGPFVRIAPNKVRGAGGVVGTTNAVYCNLVREYLERAIFFRTAYLNVTAKLDHEEMKRATPDESKTWFFTQVIRQFEPASIGGFLHDLIERLVHYVKLQQLERARPPAAGGGESKSGSKRRLIEKIAGKNITPYTGLKDTRTVCVARAMLVYAAQTRIFWGVVGFRVRFGLRSLRRKRDADAMMAALIADEERVAAKKKAIEARKLKAKLKRQAAAAAARAYTLHPVWERATKASGELVMRLEICFPTNDAACNTEDEFVAVEEFLKQRWVEAAKYAGIV